MPCINIKKACDQRKPFTCLLITRRMGDEGSDPVYPIAPGIGESLTGGSTHNGGRAPCGDRQCAPFLSHGFCVDGDRLGNFRIAVKIDFQR